MAAGKPYSRAFLNLVRAYNKLSCAASIQMLKCSLLQQEMKFRKNPYINYYYAHQVTQGKENVSPKPQIAPCTTLRTRLVTHPLCTPLPDWLDTVSSEPDITSPFNLSPITPGQIKRALKECSSPGCNGISYYHLKPPSLSPLSCHPIF